MVVDILVVDILEVDILGRTRHAVASGAEKYGGVTDCAYMITSILAIDSTVTQCHSQLSWGTCPSN